MKSLAFISFLISGSIAFGQTSKVVVAPKPVVKQAAALPANSDQSVLFSYGGIKVTVGEFLSVYKKNNVGKQIDFSEKSLGDYLKLYENFKLKVAEGKAEKLDTLPALKNELVNYRKQLAKNYLMDKVVLEKMYKEAYNRSLYEVHVQHIMVKIASDAAPKDTAEAYKRIKDLYTKVTTGKEDFSATAKEFSDDPSAKTNGGDIGFITALQAFYPFENAAYSLTKPNEISKPFRTKVGYHIIKLIEKRSTRGHVQVQHIFVSVAKAAKEEAVAEGKIRIDNLYAMLKGGKADFDVLAKDSSDDRVSAQNNGKLPWFGSGKMVQEFEDQAFKMKTKGDISEPFRTDYGFHIIKLLDKRLPDSYEKDKDDVRKNVDKDARADNAKEAFINSIKKEYKFTTNKINYEAYKATLDSTLLKSIFKANTVQNKSVLVSIDNKNYTVQDFAKYLESYQRVYRKNVNTSADIAEKAYPNWIDKICNDLAENKLEQKYPEFKTLMSEYADGIILFDITDKNVWSKAVSDTTGLKNYYNAHKEKYQWATRMDAVIFRCANVESAEKVKQMMNNNIAPDSIQKAMNRAETKGGVSFETGKYEKGNNKIIDMCNWVTGIQTVTTEKGIPCVVQVKNMINPSPKMLDEARGYVIADYQEQLETSWMNGLRAKYPIVEDEKVFKSLVK